MNDPEERHVIEVCNRGLPGLDFSQPRWKTFLTRMEPRIYAGQGVDCRVTIYEEVPSEEDIMYGHGGHKYRLRV